MSRKNKHPRKKKDPLTIDSADEAVKLVPVVLETAKLNKSPLTSNWCTVLVIIWDFCIHIEL